MFWLALAAQVVAPAPTNPEAWFAVDDVPSYLIERSSGVWFVPIRVTVGPDGKIMNCQPEFAGKIPALDDHTCKAVVRRARFRSASMDGIPAYGVHRTSIMYVVADAPWDTSKVSNPDMDVTVKSLPGLLGSPTLVRVMFAVDVTGAKSSCAADGLEGTEHVDNDPALVPIACDQIMRAYKAIPALDSGRPVPSVQSALVRFSLPQSK